ncbi:thiamine phosphate synthase [Dysgonomonas sp. ZJ709]|uniref:thiamine phosphate synthase n=1 Tax=Dysgonomonas sp. ZJ709 TaxID=2709797 RepID=UPI0013EB58BC|nr:thiamine phosphate synthase [Dysgonomonas sp. ZJ709]
MISLVVITLEEIIENEAQILNKLFKNGVLTLHLRKPLSSEQEVYLLLSQIASKYHDRIVLHDHFSLVNYFDLKGVHLNSRNTIRPNKVLLSVSRSCHSLDCLETSDDFNYVFLSPIFDSISKSGYSRAFTHEELIEATNLNIITEKVIALGGIDSDTIPIAVSYGFGGVAVLGGLWKNFKENRDENALLERFNKLKSICNQ